MKNSLKFFVSFLFKYIQISDKNDDNNTICSNRFLMRSDMLTTGGCSFSLSTDEFMDEPIAMIIAQDSPYINIINAE